VHDCDATAAAAGDRGGRVLRRPQDGPPGRHAVIADPQGAVFAITARPWS
jgi:predicted enzyme related to lactoylglutathione lyase